MNEFASLSATNSGVHIVGNDPQNQRHYFLNLSWEELYELARDKGRCVTTEEMARMSSKGIRDIMEG